MKTLIEINTNLLKGYKGLEKLNADNWDIGEYLNLNYDLNAALGFSKLYFPDFVERRGCVILAFRYDETNFEKWYNHFDGNISEVERICNSYEVMHYFNLNRSIDESPEFCNLLIDEFAKALRKSWEINCALLFPDRRFNIEVFDEYGTTRITLFSVAANIVKPVIDNS